MQQVQALASGHTYNREHRNFVRFYNKAVENKAKTREAGHVVYEVKEYVSILSETGQGDDYNSPVRGYDIQRFPEEYNKFQRRKTKLSEGLPVELLPTLSVADKALLKDMNYELIEEVAEMDKTEAKKYGENFIEFNQRAIDFLEKFYGGKEVADLKIKVEELEKNLQRSQKANNSARLKVKKLEKQLAELQPVTVEE